MSDNGQSPAESGPRPDHPSVDQPDPPGSQPRTGDPAPATVARVPIRPSVDPTARERARRDAGE